MKILIITEAETNIGGFVAVERLITEFRKQGLDVSLWTKGEVNKHGSFSSNFFKLLFIKIIKRVFQLIGREININKIKHIFKTSNLLGHATASYTSININELNNSDYDIIHLHWIYNDVISIEDIAKIKKPIIFTMHDSWLFCGAEFHPNLLENDRRFIDGYTKQNKPKTTYGDDICRKTWERKKRAWKNVKFNIISPSNFERDLLRKSLLFHNTECTVIPNIVPSEIFKSLNKNLLRDYYNVPQNKKILGFGAGYISFDVTNKGIHLIPDALKYIKDITDYFLVFFGNTDSRYLNKLDMPYFSAGAISNPYILSTIYNTCDVFICPSLIENLSTVSIEAQLCGLPVIAFQTGGNSDIVKHKETGYLAKPFDPKDLYNGIIYCMDNKEDMSKKSIKRAKTIFDNERTVKQHIDFYNEVYKNASQQQSATKKEANENHITI